MSASFLVLGQCVNPSDPKHARIEVALAKSSARDEDADALVYVTKYRSGQIGDRSIGLTRKQARDVAALLVAAAGGAT